MFEMCVDMIYQSKVCYPGPESETVMWSTRPPVWSGPPSVRVSPRPLSSVSLQALAHAHELGVVHRDLKPARKAQSTCASFLRVPCGVDLKGTQINRYPFVWSTYII